MSNLAGTGHSRGVDSQHQRMPGIDFLQRPQQFVIAVVGNLLFALFPVAAVMVFKQPDQIGFRQFFSVKVYKKIIIGTHCVLHLLQVIY